MKDSKAHYQVMNLFGMVVVFVPIFVVKVKINFQLRSNRSPSNLGCFTIENTKPHSSHSSCLGGRATGHHNRLPTSFPP